jgi:hypothetical protein
VETNAEDSGDGKLGWGEEVIDQSEPPRLPVLVVLMVRDLAAMGMSSLGTGSRKN